MHKYKVLSGSEPIQFRFSRLIWPVQVRLGTLANMAHNKSPAPTAAATGSPLSPQRQLSSPKEQVLQSSGRATTATQGSVALVQFRAWEDLNDLKWQPQVR